MVDMPKIEVRTSHAPTYDEAVYSAGIALDQLAVWFLDDGHDEGSFLDRCAESWERASDD